MSEVSVSSNGFGGAVRCLFEIPLAIDCDMRAKLMFLLCVLCLLRERERCRLSSLGAAAELGSETGALLAVGVAAAAAVIAATEPRSLGAFFVPVVGAAGGLNVSGAFGAFGDDSVLRSPTNGVQG